MTGRTDALEVRLYGDVAATLTRSAPFQYVLEYSSDWLHSVGAVPLSMSLPLIPRKHRGQVVADFLDNLLPDSQGVRDRWATDAGLESTEPFLLLGAYGRDVAGALEFVHQAEPPRIGALQPVDDRQIAARIAALDRDATAWILNPEDVGRFSLGGAQSKFALAQHEGAWFEPSGTAPATHIFKPVVQHLSEGEVVEFVVLRAAAEIGLPTAPASLQWFGSERSLVVERFDRVRLADGSVERLHQEDVLQALGRPRLQKYESHGGPTYRAVLELLDRGWPEDAERSKLTFVRALAFSWLMLNTDAHGKNYALLLQSDSLQLAPLYDVSSLIPYLPGDSTPASARRTLERAMADTKLSMSALGSYRSGDMSAETWRTVARDARLDPSEFLAWIRDVCDRIADVVQDEIRALDARDSTEITDRLMRRIRIRATQAAQTLDS